MGEGRVLRAILCFISHNSRPQDPSRPILDLTRALGRFDQVHTHATCRDTAHFTHAMQMCRDRGSSGRRNWCPRYVTTHRCTHPTYAYVSLVHVYHIILFSFSLILCVCECVCECACVCIRYDTGVRPTWAPGPRRSSRYTVGGDLRSSSSSQAS